MYASKNIEIISSIKHFCRLIMRRLTSELASYACKIINEYNNNNNNNNNSKNCVKYTYWLRMNTSFHSLQPTVIWDLSIDL